LRDLNDDSSTRNVPGAAPNAAAPDHAVGTEETSIVEAARRGEDWAWLALYEDLAPRVQGYFRAHQIHHPEDLTADVFLDVARRIQEFRGDSRRFRSWVFTIAHSRLVDEVRRSCRRGTQIPLDHAATIVSSHDVENEVVDRIGQQSLFEAMAVADCLTDSQRQVVMLRLLGDLSVAETAAALGKSETSVKVTLHRAVRVLQNHFAGKGVTELADERLLG
jgi:RNA polymerase sigma factor (sigma-70 family)